MAEAELNCTFCGTAVDPGMTACPDCGAPIEPFQNFATREDREAVVAAEVGRYENQGWYLIGLSETTARLHKGKAVRVLRAEIDGSLTDEIRQGENVSHTVHNWVVAIFAVTVIVLLVIVALTGDHQTSTPSGSSTSSAASTASPEFMLATLQKGYVGKDDALIKQYARQLDLLGDRCDATRTQLSNMAFATNKILHDHGISETRPRDDDQHQSFSTCRTANANVS